MVYYTDQDRARAAQSRRMNSRVRARRESPEDALDIRNDMVRDLLGLKVGPAQVPKIMTRPKLESYELPENIEEVLREQDERSAIAWQQKRQKRKEALIAFWVVATIITSFSTAIAFFINDTTATLMIIVIAAAILRIVYSFLKNDISSSNYTYYSVGSPLQAKYSQYKEDLEHYEYWKRKRDAAHWQKLGGHQFEVQVAILFRSIGFTTVVSKVGGDGGIDIILTKLNRKIAVQCKRYKQSVGPHVARDLWGTMNANGYTEGCIVTTTGFTKGVKDFVEGKNIHLIDLNDILRTVKDSSYLERKLSN